MVEAQDDDGDQRFAGTISLRNEDDGRAEIAYGSHPWVRGRGVMERALRLLLEWGFAERDLQTVIWLARRGNWASRRLAWRLGFSFDGHAALLAARSATGCVDAWVGHACVAVSRCHRGRAWLRAPRIVGDSVVLRATAEADIPRLVEGGNDPQVQRYSQSLREHAPHDEAKARERELGLLEESARGRVADVDRGGRRDRRAARLGGAVRDRTGGEAEVGYWAHPDARGRGVTIEACRLAVRHAFIDTEDGGLGLHRLTAYAADGQRSPPSASSSGPASPGSASSAAAPCCPTAPTSTRPPTTSWPTDRLRRPA